MLALLALIVIPSGAVLKEKDLNQSLSILRHELEKAHDEMGEKQKRMAVYTDQMRQNLFKTMSQADQNALMLYSQKQDYVFDLTYACNEATTQYREFTRATAPFRKHVDNSAVEVARYDSLIQSLTTMPVMMLDEQAKTDRNVCLALAVNVRRMVKENSQSLQEYIRLYQFCETRLKTLNDYAQKRYSDIQDNIFINGGENYFTILKNAGYHMVETEQTVIDKYESYRHVNSQWDSRFIVFLFVIILVYGAISAIINIVILRYIANWLIKKGRFRDSIAEAFKARRACIIMASSVVTFAILLNIVRAFSNQNFLIMASDLLTEYAWLMGVILISILIRVDANKTLKTFYVYSPLLLMGFIVITFRIILIPNELVSFIFPPILLFCMIWQWIAIYRHRKEIHKGDLGLTMVSHIVVTTAVIASWIGYTLLSVQILIWWIMLLTCILTIVCIKDWHANYKLEKKIDKRPITKTWFHLLFTKVIIPTAAVFSVLVSIYWAADVFNLTDLTMKIYHTRFIDTEDFVLSLENIALVIILWFVFSYLNYIAKAFIRYHYRQIDRNVNNAESRAMMFINVVQIVIIGIWFLLSLAILHVSSTWIVVISGGLSTGIGFASKDILENIYYGISLMAGRIKIGDMIICNEERGKVVSISYTSTMIEAIDGSIIAFQNSQLFTMNYKNLTRNHGYEMSTLEVGVNYGANIAEVRKILVEAITEQCDVNLTKDHGVSVVIKEFGDNSVNLKIICWVNAMKALTINGQIMEVIYDTLNKNNVEIPFPQRDVHIIKE